MHETIRPGRDLTETSDVPVVEMKGVIEKEEAGKKDLEAMLETVENSQTELQELIKNMPLGQEESPVYKGIVGQIEAMEQTRLGVVEELRVIKNRIINLAEAQQLVLGSVGTMLNER